MHALKTAVLIAWIPFWIGWLAAAFSANRSVPRRRRLPGTGLSVVALIVLARVLGRGNAAVHSPVLGGFGAAMFVSGLAVAIWARVYLGRNWGVPMSERAEPELVTSGPYRSVRHPIYSGLLLAFVGTALVTSLLGLAIAALLGAYFYYSATVEERNLTATFPSTYPAYRATTKKLIPFVL